MVLFISIATGVNSFFAVLHWHLYRNTMFRLRSVNARSTIMRDANHTLLDKNRALQAECVELRRVSARFALIQRIIDGEEVVS